MAMKKEELAAMIDHTILGANITKEEVIKLCDEAVEYGFASVCTEPYFMSLTSEKLADTTVKNCTVIGFPFGNTSTESKVIEADQAIIDGADELDMVINISALKEGNTEYVLNDIKAVVETKRKVKREIIIKVIIETCYLNKEEKVLACNLAEKAGANFVKTSTGFGTDGANIDDVNLMKSNVGDNMLIKASGGIRSYNDA